MKNIIPLGDRILVKKKTVGESEEEGLIKLPDSVKERDTDLAEVVYIPDYTFADKELLDNSEEIINTITKKALEGSSEALKAVLEFNQYLKLKTIKPGDRVFISKYVGVTFYDNHAKQNYTIVNSYDIIGIVAGD